MSNVRDFSLPSLCVVTPYRPALTETFIRSHIDNLPARVVTVHGWRPSIDEKPVLSRPQLALYKLWRTISRSGLERETTTAYLKVFQQYRVDAVLAEYGETGVLVMEACRTAQIPLIVHFHGYDASVRSVLEAHSKTYPAMLSEAAAVIAVSRAMQRKLLSLGAPAEKVHYNPYGIDCYRFKGSDAANSQPVFLSVGRFVDKKAPQLTLRAFAEVYRAYPEARLRMIGDGPLLEECENLAHQFGIGEAITFLGAQPHTVVQAEMRAARCFVQHSIEAPSGDCEGTPVGILEAGASGLPVISTRHAGIPDVVLDEETGLLVDERDVKGMAERMLRLARDPEFAATLGRAARQRIETHFTMDQSLTKLWNVIASCIRRSGNNSDKELNSFPTNDRT